VNILHLVRTINEGKNVAKSFFGRHGVTSCYGLGRDYSKTDFNGGMGAPSDVVPIPST
jgi:hypothetical protein